MSAILAAASGGPLAQVVEQGARQEVQMRRSLRDRFGGTPRQAGLAWRAQLVTALVVRTLAGDAWSQAVINSLLGYRRSVHG